MGKSALRKAYEKAMGTSKAGTKDPSVGKAIGAIKGAEGKRQAAIDKALGNTGKRTDLDDTGADW